MPPWGGWSFPCHCVVSSPWQHPPPSRSHLSSQPRPRTISFWCRSSPLSSPLGSRTDKPFSRPPELRAKPNQPLRIQEATHQTRPLFQESRGWQHASTQGPTCAVKPLRPSLSYSPYLCSLTALDQGPLASLPTGVCPPYNQASCFWTQMCRFGTHVFEGHQSYEKGRCLRVTGPC